MLGTVGQVQSSGCVTLGEWLHTSVCLSDEICKMGTMIGPNTCVCLSNEFCKMGGMVGPNTWVVSRIGGMTTSKHFGFISYFMCVACVFVGIHACMHTFLQGLGVRACRVLRLLPGLILTLFCITL